MSATSSARAVCAVLRLALASAEAGVLLPRRAAMPKSARLRRSWICSRAKLLVDAHQHNSGTKTEDLKKEIVRLAAVRTTQLSNLAAIEET